ncbi:MAG: hypothetical protein GF353_09585 [Candidatus Lokiarchaeota archaeon]|nr:hypothetical protein [Candidatus Lokiarchaeota archaeon]
MKIFKNLHIITITLIQLAIATSISILFQFVFPMTWQPLDVAMYGPEITHEDSNTNMVIATISQWYFSLSIAWLIYRENPYINNFLIYSIVSLTMIVFIEFFVYQLFWDFIHLTPLVVDVYLLAKKRDTLFQKWLPFYLVGCSFWYFAVYLLDLAYFGAPLLVFFFNWSVITSLCVLISFGFPDSVLSKMRKQSRNLRKKEIALEPLQNEI